MSINKSKESDPRMREKWKKSGAEQDGTFDNLNLPITKVLLDYGEGPGYRSLVGLGNRRGLSSNRVEPVVLLDVPGCYTVGDNLTEEQKGLAKVVSPRSVTQSMGK
jgi:hypothetical protein